MSRDCRQIRVTHGRAAALRAEIVNAEAKLRRLREAIEHRKQILNRLEAAAVFNDGHAPDRDHDE